MKLQYGILGMALVSGAVFAHDENAEGIQVGGYVDARYTWQNEAAGRTNSFSLPEGAIYAGKRVGGTRVFIDAGFALPAATTLATVGQGIHGADFSVKQAYVSNMGDSGFSWQAGRFDGIFGWVANDSGHYQLSGRGMIQGTLPESHGGLLLGYSFSDMLNVKVLIDSESTLQLGTGGTGTYAHNFDMPVWGVKLGSKMEAFDLDLGFVTEDSDTLEGSSWGLDLVAGTKFGKYDFKAIFVMGSAGTDADATMGFGAQMGGDVSEGISAAARVEWMKVAKNDTALAFTVGPQFNVEKGFVVKADYMLTSLGGTVNANAKAQHAINVAAVYDF